MLGTSLLSAMRMIDGLWEETKREKSVDLGMTELTLRKRIEICLEGDITRFEWMPPLIES